MLGAVKQVAGFLGWLNKQWEVLLDSKDQPFYSLLSLAGTLIIPERRKWICLGYPSSWGARDTSCSCKATFTPVRPVREAGQLLPGATKPQCSPWGLTPFWLSSGSMGKSTCIGFVLQDPNRILISFVLLMVVQLVGGKELAGRWVSEASFKSTACQKPGEVITGKCRLFL